MRTVFGLDSYRRQISDRNALGAPSPRIIELLLAGQQ